jgi:ribonucleoside-diphosphate reductase alpha chain
MERICHSAYRASAGLAAEKGPFPFFDAEPYLEGPFVRSLPEDVRTAVREQGLRNSHLTAVAPTGTISLFANNVSSGVEPVYDFEYRRRVRGADGEYAWHDLQDYALREWRRLRGDEAVPDWFVDAHDLMPRDHLAMQAAVQPFVDNAISKTINVPEHFEFGAFESLYQEAYDLGLKGCTTFRPNPVTGSVLAAGEPPTVEEPGAQCCSLDREND